MQRWTNHTGGRFSTITPKGVPVEAIRITVGGRRPYWALEIDGQRLEGLARRLHSVQSWVDDWVKRGEDASLLLEPRF